MPTTLHFKPGEIIFLEGERSNNLYVLEKGEVEVLKDHQVIRVMSEKHTFFGEMAYFLKDRRSATLRAKSEVEVIEVDFKDSKKFDQKLSAISLSLMKVMASRLDDNTKKIIRMNCHRSFSEKLRKRALEHPEIQAIVDEIDVEIEEEFSRGTRELLGDYMLSPSVFKRLKESLEEVLQSHLKDDYEFGPPLPWKANSPPLGSMACINFSGERKGTLILDISEYLAFQIEKKTDLKEEELGELCLKIMNELGGKSGHLKVHMKEPNPVRDMADLEKYLTDGRAIEILVTCSAGKLRLIYQLS